ncbi:hypothetical protein D3C77_478670 [compost metagenome]
MLVSGYQHVYPCNFTANRIALIFPRQLLGSFTAGKITLKPAMVGDDEQIGALLLPDARHPLFHRLQRITKFQPLEVHWIFPVGDIVCRHSEDRYFDGISGVPYFFHNIRRTESWFPRLLIYNPRRQPGKTRFTNHAAQLIQSVVEFMITEHSRIISKLVQYSNCRMGRTLPMFNEIRGERRSLYNIAIVQQ